MKLRDIKREKGRVRTLEDLLRILFNVYEKDIFKNGRFAENNRCYILPTCILISKMFSMQVAYDESENKHYVYFKNKYVDVEKLICNIEEDEDLPFTMADLYTIDSAVVIPPKCSIIPISKLSQDTKTKTCYNDVVSRIEKYLKTSTEINTYYKYKFQASEGRKIKKYSSNNDTYVFEKDKNEEKHHENRYYAKPNDIYEDEYGILRENKSYGVSKIIEEDYDINLDDVESDYYEADSYE